MSKLGVHSKDRVWKRYPAYKESGVEWLGEIPESWEIKCAKFIFRRMARPIKDEDDIVTAFRDGIVTLRVNRRTEGFTFSLKEIGYQGVRKGDLDLSSSLCQEIYSQGKSSFKLYSKSI